MSIQKSFIDLCLRFLISGGLATALHWLTMWALVQSSINATISTAIGSIIGAAANYLLQYYHTFRCQEKHVSVIPAYIKVCTVGWLANVIIFYLIFNYLLPNAAWAQLCTTFLITFLNFYLYQQVVFYERRNV